MLSALQSAALGAVQGLTEFLPISSTGHLILARELLGIQTEGGLAFDAILQLGSILAVFVVFHKDVQRLIITAWRLVMERGRNVIPEDKTLLTGILLGTIPALAFGLLLQKKMETVFRSPLLVACTLILGSLLFIAAERYAKQKRTLPDVKRAWWIGVFQTLALVPGVSRSGATISGGLLLGLTRESATRFSFLLSLPIITGSGLLKFKDVLQDGSTDFTLTTLAIGFATSFAVGYLCIRWLIQFLKTHSLMPFVWYRLGLAAVVLLTISL